MNRIEHVSLSNSTYPPRPVHSTRFEAPRKTGRRKLYSRQPESRMPVPVPQSAPLPGALLL